MINLQLIVIRTVVILALILWLLFKTFITIVTMPINVVYCMCTFNMMSLRNDFTEIFKELIAELFSIFLLIRNNRMINVTTIEFEYAMYQRKVSNDTTRLSNMLQNVDKCIEIINIQPNSNINIMTVKMCNRKAIRSVCDNTIALKSVGLPSYFLLDTINILLYKNTLNEIDKIDTIIRINEVS